MTDMSNMSNTSITDDSNNSNGSCPICLQDMQVQELLRELHCGHLFHDDCIEHWFSTSDTKRCPVCRYDEERGMNTEISTSTAPRLVELADYDLDLDDLFGNFPTDDGGTVFIYEGPRGIIMVRMFNVNIPRRTQLVRMPVRPTTRDMARTVRQMMFSRTRSFFRRIWSKMRSCFV